MQYGLRWQLKAIVAIGVLLGLAHSVVHAQPAPPYSPPDRELWELMVKAFSEIPTTLNAHNQIQNIMQSVQREALIREMKAKAPPPKEPAQ